MYYQTLNQVLETDFHEQSQVETDCFWKNTAILFCPADKKWGNETNCFKQKTKNDNLKFEISSHYPFHSSISI